MEEKTDPHKTRHSVLSIILLWFLILNLFLLLFMSVFSCGNKSLGCLPGHSLKHCMPITDSSLTWLCADTCITLYKVIIRGSLTNLSEEARFGCAVVWTMIIMIIIMIILITSFKLEFSSSSVFMEITKNELADNLKGILIFSKLFLVSFLLNIFCNVH